MIGQDLCQEGGSLWQERTERFGQIMMLKSEAAAPKFHREDTSACEQGFISHLAESEPSGKGGHAEESRAAQSRAESPSEFAVRDWRGRNNVHRSEQRVSHQCMMDRSNGIVDRDPTPVLLAGADHAAQSHFERRQHLGQRAALQAEDDPEAQMDHSDSSFGGVSC